jgi:ubiquinone/menaquinone biosynthesis C-methylase UbiE
LTPAARPAARRLEHLSMSVLQRMRGLLSAPEPVTPAPAVTAPAARDEASSQDYWSGYHVDSPDEGFRSVAASLDHFDWRNRQYPGYLELMPVDRADGLVVMDYGCGPGNDVIGFGHFSRPKRIVALDVSSQALGLAQQRARLHGLAVEFKRLRESPVEIPLEDASVDLVHCSGVLHHTPDPAAILREFRRVLRPGGCGQIMVYHHDSIWMHLYVAYLKTIVEGRFGGLTKRQAYSKTMDGPDCPIAECYTAAEFTAVADRAGLRSEFAGAAMSTHELKLLPSRFEAIEDKRLDAESRRFLYDLTFNDRGWPLHGGVVAGVNACFRIFPR